MKTLCSSFFFALQFVLVLLMAGCSSAHNPASEESSRLVLPNSAYPSVAFHDGKFYFIRQEPDIRLYAADCIDSLSSANPVTVLSLSESGMDHIWSPEIYRIGDKWYIYFEADDGNTDNHQIYVLENGSSDPLKGEWTLHGPIITDNEWNFGIHPSTFIVGDRQYLLWSGWEHRRAETETQCIFIAELENPWTLKSERKLLSRPEYEWERQWINPDGARSAYPIFVNENPEGFMSPDGKKVFVGYSASGVWTPYKTLGLLYADSDADLLDINSWTKMEEPCSPIYSDTTRVTAISNIAVLPNYDDSQSTLLFFQGNENTDGNVSTNIYVSELGWDENSMPVFNFRL